MGTFFFVTLVFAITFLLAGVPVYLAFIFGGIALATAPAPALSIVNEFHAKGPVTNTLLPMAVLDDIVAIIVFFTVNSVVASSVSGGSVSLYMIPVMILLPVIICLVTGLPAGRLLSRVRGRIQTLSVLLAGITLTAGIGWLINTKILSGITLNYHLILGAGFYTFLYIAARGTGKYFGARFGAKVMKMPDTVQKYLGLTLLRHSGVSLVFTGIACATLASQPDLVGILQGTIAAAAVINEIIAVIAAKKGFISSPRYGKVFNLCVSASDCFCTARNVSNSESVCGAMTSPASSLSNISLCLHPLSDEIRKCYIFVLRLGNPCVFSSFPSFQQICHVCAERTHGLQAFLVLSGFLRYKAVDLIPVLGRNHMHICHQKILIQPFKGSRCSASAA